LSYSHSLPLIPHYNPIVQQRFRKIYTLSCRAFHNYTIGLAPIFKYMITNHLYPSSKGLLQTIYYSLSIIVHYPKTQGHKGTFLLCHYALFTMLKFMPVRRDIKLCRMVASGLQYQEYQAVLGWKDRNSGCVLQSCGILSRGFKHIQL
jgi:hypothetical protein